MSVAKHLLSVRHLLGIKNLSQDDIIKILDLAGHYADLGHKPEAFDRAFGKLVLVNVFLEPSTRTKMSFEMAAHRLGLKPVNFEGASSSLKKGETLLDTLAAIAAMKPDVMIVRQNEEGLLEKAAAFSPCPLINAGDGAGEHPTQALLDALTIQRRKGGIEGLNIAICGDIAHSRVARSNFYLLTKLGANVRAFGPAGLMPATLPAGVKGAATMNEALEGADVVMMLRVQLERMVQKPSLEKYFKEFGLSREKLSLAKPDAIVMHPGPINRGVEIADEVADDPERSVIQDQVANGVAVRMAVLDLLTRPVRKESA
jgi:aspartate carbamoyltransferase catalytic subunit